MKEFINGNLKNEVKIESINVKKHEEIKFYEENKVIYSEEILNNKDSIIRTVHDNSKINRCETCGKIIDFSCKILPWFYLSYFYIP